MSSRYVGPAGAAQSIRGALDWVVPYALSGAPPWPYSEETPFDRTKFFQLLRVASLKYDAHDSGSRSVVTLRSGAGAGSGAGVRSSVTAAGPGLAEGGDYEAMIPRLVGMTDAALSNSVINLVWPRRTAGEVRVRSKRTETGPRRSGL